MYHVVTVSTLPDHGSPYTLAESQAWRALTQGNCPRKVAVDAARNAIRFGGWESARVFAGARIGRLVFTVNATPDDSGGEIL